MLAINLLINGLVTGCALGVVAVSFQLAYSTTRIFHVAHAGVYTLAGYLAFSMIERGLPDPLAIVVAAMICAALGALIQYVLYATLERRGASHLSVLIASLGALAVIQNAISAFYSPNIIPFTSAWRGQMMSVGLTQVQVATLLVCLAVFGAAVLFAKLTPLGKRIRAVASNPFLAEITRLRPQPTYVIVMAIASAMVAVPGILVPMDFGLQPYNGTTVLLTATIAVIAGGIGSLTGAFALAVIITVLQNLSLLAISGEWSVGITFSIFLIFMLFRPRGLFAQQ
jgi:branched-chain amino acid transport system permease protein